MKIACCGLDCSKCKAYKATIEDNQKLKEETAKEWSKLNNVDIKPEEINCLGCNECGVKTPFCDHLCPIRICAKNKKYKTCGDCDLLDKCEIIKMIISNNPKALKNLLHEKE